MSSPQKQQRPYGLWSSSITPRTIAGQVRLMDALAVDDGVLWVEGRGKQGLVVHQRGVEAPRDVFTNQSARGGVGYGGGELAVRGDQYFMAESEGRLWTGSMRGGEPRPITPAFGSTASPAPTPDGAHVAYVHTVDDVDVLALVDSQGRGWPKKIAEGADFYMQPAWHPAQTYIAWVSWDQPNMPWDGTLLEMSRVHSDERGVHVDAPVVLAGGDQISVQQPCFSPDGAMLAYLSDETGWSHLYVRDLKTQETTQLSEGEADHSTPGWVQGLRHIAWLPDSSGLLALRHVKGSSELWRYELGQGAERVRGLEEYTALAQLSVNEAGDAALIGSSSVIPPRVLSLHKDGSVRVVRRATAEMIHPDELSRGRAVEWPSLDGQTVYGNYYAPASQRFESVGAPPVMLMIHGGPTSQAIAGWSSKVQFFTTRGYAVLEVNYRGSTGHGRAYMEALRGKWGIYDREDAVSAVQFLDREGLGDPERVVIMGGSAGGYTVLHALVKHPGVFAAGVSMYGISNLFALASGTHKFEAAYNDSLIGPLPEAAEAYRERSPLFFADQLSDPVAIYQGEDDQVVPPDQAEAIVKSLQARGVPHTYHLYEGEGHGWRKAETVHHFYTSLLEFLNQFVVYK